jgi:hypothetical protein
MSPGAQWAIAIIVLVNSLFVGGIAVALWLLHAKLAQALHRTEPLLQRANELVGKLDALASTVEARMTGVLDTAERLVRDVTQKVDTTTSIAEETISQPLIGAASLMAGISRGLDAYREMTEKGEGQQNG